MDMAAGRAFLPENRSVLVVIPGLHQMVAEGARFSGNNQSAVTDPLASVQTHINEFDMVFIPSVNYSPEKAVAVTLLVITGTGEIGFACGQDCIVAGYGNQLLDFHQKIPRFLFLFLDSDYCPFCHASAYLEIVFFIKGDIWVYINNGSLTIYIFIDIRIYYRSHDAEIHYFHLRDSGQKGQKSCVGYAAGWYNSGLTM